jgi:APA family basic amino acid/polyamine antiporter
MGEDFALLNFFARRSKNDVPSVAILFQLVVSSVLMLTQSFEAVLDFIQFSLTLCSFFAVLGVIILRFTRPELPRPYRAWGYPVTPLIFLSVTGFMMYYLVINRPVQSLAGVLLMLAGVILYWIAQAHPAQPATQEVTFRK